VDQYNGYKVIDDYHINGELTLGENISDYGGLVISFEAYKMATATQKNIQKGGRFHTRTKILHFLCTGMEAKYQKRRIDTACQGRCTFSRKFRVNGGVFNIPAFYEAFRISPSDPLYRKPELRPAIW